jgi:hypothetical protein
MIKRITIEDYMAHHHTTLDLGPGVTVLTGPNNVGKSAVVEAIRSVAQNPAPEHVIRHGAAQAVVRVELDSGEIIEWVRKKASAVYRLYRPAVPMDLPGHGSNGSEVEPEVYAKFGRTPPDDIRQLLRLDQVETETGPVDIHIGNQRYPIFLLDQSGSQAASFFAASTEAEYLLRMRQALKARTDSSKRQVKELQSECTRMEKELERFLPLDRLDVDLIVAEELHTAIQGLQQSMPLLIRAIQSLADIERQHAVKRQGCAVLADLMEPPLPFDTTTLAGQLGELENTLGQLGLAQSRSGILVPLAEPPMLQDNAALSALLSGLESTEISLLRNRRLTGSLSHLEVPPELHGIPSLAELCSTLDQAEAAQACTSAAGHVLLDLVAPPQIHDTAPLEDLAQQWSVTAGHYRTATRCADALYPLTVPPLLHDPSGLKVLIGVIDDGERCLQGMARRQAILEEVRPCPEPVEVARLEEVASRLARLEDAMQAIHQEQQACLMNLEKLGREIQDALAEAGICPLCGQMLDMVHFLEAPHE